MILHQDMLDEVRDRVEREPEATFTAAGITRESILNDADKMESLWMFFQKSVQEYEVDPDYAYADSMKELFGIHVEGGKA